MDMSNIAELTAGAAVGLGGMWLMFKLCQQMLGKAADAFQQLATEIKADREAHTAEHKAIMDRIDGLEKRIQE